MKIIAVNIRNSIDQGKSLQNATSSFWLLDYYKCKSGNYDFVIGVINGQIATDSNQQEALSRLINIIQNGERIVFDLHNCTSLEAQKIKDYVNSNNINLGGFTTKYI